MASKGIYIFDGYIKGRGMVRVFTDLDNSQFVFAESMKKDIQWYILRSKVSPRKNEKSTVKSQTQDSKEIVEEVQLSLF